MGEAEITQNFIIMNYCMSKWTQRPSSYRRRQLSTHTLHSLLVSTPPLNWFNVNFCCSPNVKFHYQQHLTMSELNFLSYMKLVSLSLYHATVPESESVISLILHAFPPSLCFHMYFPLLRSTFYAITSVNSSSAQVSLKIYCLRILS